MISQETELRRVNIFDGDDIYYGEHRFESKNDFIKQYNDLNNNMMGRVLGVPADMWNEKTDDRKGAYIYLNYEKDGVFMFAIIMNSKVYITNKGQTVDTFMI